MLIALTVRNAQMRKHAKFRGNRPEHDRDIAFFELQDGSRPPSWIFKNSKF